MAAGRFEDAGSVRDQIEAVYGSCAETVGLETLDALAAAPWHEPAPALAEWERIASRIQTSTALRARIHDGVFARLLQSHAPETIAAAKPECLPDLTASLLRAGGDGATRAGDPRLSRVARGLSVSGEGGARA